MTNTTTTQPTATLDHAEIVWSDADKYSPGHFSVNPIWSGVDRPNVGGWSVGSNEALGKRLVRAIEAGAVCVNATVATDVNGNTYVTSDAHLRVSGRRMNADLKRLGF